MRPLQVLSQQVQILHRGRHFAMPEHNRQPHDVAAASEVLSRERMPQQVKAASWKPETFEQIVVAAERVALMPPAAFTSGEHQLRYDLGAVLHLTEPIEHLA